MDRLTREFGELVRRECLRLAQTWESDYKVTDQRDAGQTDAQAGIATRIINLDINTLAPLDAREQPSADAVRDSCQYERDDGHVAHRCPNCAYDDLTINAAEGEKKC